MPANLFKNKIVVLATFTGAALMIFAQSTGRIFLSDDYCTLNNIVANKSVWLETFFRPVGDLSLMWTYRIFGWDPFYFYLINILLHTVNSFLLYVFCLQWYGNENRNILFAIAAGIIFLTYPSHSEAILWAIGRGVSLAVFFSLLAMITVISDIKRIPKIIFAALLYFIALASYESVMLLPLVLLYLVSKTHRTQTRAIAVVLGLTLAVHIFLRYALTGGMWKAYNGVIFSKDLVEFFSTFIKIMMRMFVPPFNNPLAFTLCGAGVFSVLFLIIYKRRDLFVKDWMFSKTMLMIVAGLLSTVVVALSFGLSTRTSEGDRLMYFPSVFYAILIALLTVRLIGSIKAVWVTLVAVVLVQTVFLVISQRHWNRASDIAVKVINGIGAHSQRPLYIVNLPSDHEGAYVFRNCLPEALVHYGVDSTDVRVLNIVQSTEIEKRKVEIVPEVNGVYTFIWPEVFLEMRNGHVVSVKIGADSAVAVGVPASSVLFWNKNELKSLEK